MYVYICTVVQGAQLSSSAVLFVIRDQGGSGGSSSKPVEQMGIFQFFELCCLMFSDSISRFLNDVFVGPM